MRFAPETFFSGYGHLRVIPQILWDVNIHLECSPQSWMFQIHVHLRRKHPPENSHMLRSCFNPSFGDTLLVRNKSKNTPADRFGAEPKTIFSFPHSSLSTLKTCGCNEVYPYTWEKEKRWTVTHVVPWWFCSDHVVWLESSARDVHRTSSTPYEYLPLAIECHAHRIVPLG